MPDTRTPLITDEDARAASDAWFKRQCYQSPDYTPKGGFYVPETDIRYMLDVVAPVLRGRWVVEALEKAAEVLEDLANRDPKSVFPPDGTSRDAISGTALRAVLTALAAEYRAGTR